MNLAKRLHILLLILTVASLLFHTWQHRERYLRPYDYEYFGKLYSESQYVKGELSQGGIGDDGLYAFAGYYYIKGGDISQVSFESPPLAKYLIGLSIVLFGNELIINIFYAIWLLIVVYFLAFSLSQNPLISALATFIVGIDRLITGHFIISLLDLPMTVLFLSGVYLYVLAAQSTRPRWLFFLSSLSFALSFVTRFFPILPVLLVVLSLGLLKKGKDYYLPFIVYNIFLLPVIYLLSHFVYFYYHPSLIDFLRYQWWIINWRLGDPFAPGNILTTIFYGQYRSWWTDEWIYAKEWTVLMPIVVILGSIGIWRWRKKFPHRIISVMVGVFFGYVAIGTVGVAKFILPVYPIFIIAAVEVFIHLFKRSIGYLRQSKII